MGRKVFKLSTSAAGFLNLDILFAHLSSSGKVPVSNKSFITCVMKGNNSPTHIFMNEVEMVSSSHVVEADELMKLATSSSVTGLNSLNDEVASSQEKLYRHHLVMTVILR